MSNGKPINPDYLIEKVDEIHEVLVELRTKFGTGPGNWPSCVSHDKVLESIEKRLGAIERRMWMVIGAIGILMFLADTFGPYIRGLIHLAPTAVK